MAGQLNDATFLLVDDDQISIMAMQRAMRKLEIDNRTLVARDGREALDILHNEVETAGGALPPFIVALDINMPRMNGIEFLDVVSADPSLQDIVVLPFSSHEITRDALTPYEPHVAAHLCKDNPRDSLFAALSTLGGDNQTASIPA
ncbi:response regulator [uncultured Roseobacter sp.]|uniref:response regulator n=1 Tax=uncultured Roseobacter sp. TaxID=114847 RepID=UPI00260746AA|nr:response regulator [uncultured Roseobacter sp.]